MRQSHGEGPFAQGSPELAGVVHRNIRALLEVRKEFERRKRPDQRIADAVTGFAGSMYSVLLHAVFFGGWIIVNLGRIPGVRPWDPFPFVMLAMFASVEAIFLTTFVLVSQNRMAELSEKRADLDLQINLLAEHEVTRLVELTDAIALHLGVPLPRVSGIEELKRDVPPELVLKEIEDAEEEAAEQAA